MTQWVEPTEPTSVEKPLWCQRETADLPWADFTFYLKKRKQRGKKIRWDETDRGRAAALIAPCDSATGPAAYQLSRKQLAEGGGKEQLQAKRTVKYGLHLKLSWQIQEKLSNALLARSIKSQTFRDFSCTENCITISYKKNCISEKMKQKKLFQLN